MWFAFENEDSSHLKMKTQFLENEDLNPLKMKYMCRNKWKVINPFLKKLQLAKSIKKGSRMFVGAKFNWLIISNPEFEIVLIEIPHSIHYNQRL